MRTKTKSAPSRKSGKPRRSSASKTNSQKSLKPKRSQKPKAPKKPKEICGAPLKRRKGAFCALTAVTGGRCRNHIVDEAVSNDFDSLRRLQEAAERHAFFADQAMKEGGNGSKDATFNRNARTAAALAKARLDLKLRSAKTKDGDATIDDTNIMIVDNQRGDGPKPDAAPDAANNDEAAAAAEDAVAKPNDTTEPDAS